MKFLENTKKQRKCIANINKKLRLFYKKVMYNKKVCVNTVVKIGNTYEFKEEEGTKILL